MFSQGPLKYSDLELLGVSENHHGEGGSGDEREGGEGPLLLAPGPVLLAVLGDHALGKARIEVERDISAHLLILQIHCEPSQIIATRSKCFQCFAYGRSMAAKLFSTSDPRSLFSTFGTVPFLLSRYIRIYIQKHS